MNPTPVMKKLNDHQTGYRTLPRPVAFLDRTFPELSLYGRFLYIVFKSSAKARHGKYTDEQWSDSSLFCLHALEKIGVQLDISGLNHIEGLSGPCVFIGNHMSMLETVVLPCVIRPFRRVTYIVKQSLLDYPVFGPVMRSRDPISVTRTHPRKDLTAVLEGGTERLGRGVSIIVFPQTTRTPAFDPGQFSTLGVKLALKADVPVVPMALKTDAWGNGKYLKDFGRVDPSKPVHIAFDRPIRVRGRGNEEHQAIIRFISTQLAQWEKG